MTESFRGAAFRPRAKREGGLAARRGAALPGKGRGRIGGEGQDPGGVALLAHQGAAT